MSDVCVVGLGKIGLPLACAIALGGHRVRGADVSIPVVEMVNRGEEPFPGERGLAQALEACTASGLLSATTDTAAAVSESTVVIIVVPLVVDGDAKPDFAGIDSATRAVAEGLRDDALVIYETTLPVGTTRSRFTPALLEGSERELGKSLHIAHSPERVFSGRIFEDLRSYPKLVGGVDAASASRATSFYESFITFDRRDDLPRANGVWNLGSCEAAELAKLAETTYRDVNIAYANELAIAAEGAGLNVHDVIEACNSQPFSHIHRPGISVGGHCIPVYPHFLLNSVRGMRLPALARQINSQMPERSVLWLEETIGPLRGVRVLVLGISYRGGVKEDAFSGFDPIVRHLADRGALVEVHDPLYTDEEIRSRGLVPGAVPASGRYEAAILHTDHAAYVSLTSADLGGLKAIYDGRRVLDRDDWPGVIFGGVGTHSSS